MEACSLKTETCGEATKRESVCSCDLEVAGGGGLQRSIDTIVPRGGHACHR